MQLSKHNCWASALLSIGWLAALCMVVLPWDSLPGLPTGLRASDFLILILLLPLSLLLAFRPYLPRVEGVALPTVFFWYAGTVLILPIIGILLLGAPFSWYLGDLRWLQVLLLMLAFWLCYADRQPAILHAHFVRFVWVLVLVQFPFLLMQLGVLLGMKPFVLLEIWYAGGEVGYGSYGQYSGRFAAAMVTASGLAFVGGMGFIAGGLQAMHSPNVYSVGLFGLSAVLMIAAGNRSMLLGAPVALMFIAGTVVLMRGRMRRSLFGWAAVVLALSVPLGVALYTYNVGRIATSDRYLEVLGWLTGQRTFESISGGRGGETWAVPIAAAFRDWTPLGTLVNSPKALDHLPVMDSYFIVAIAQAGPLIILPFLTLVAMLMHQGFRLLLQRDSAGVAALSVAVPTLLSAITQNTMTALLPRVALALAVLTLIHNARARHADRLSRLQ